MLSSRDVSKSRGAELAADALRNEQRQSVAGEQQKELLLSPLLLPLLLPLFSLLLPVLLPCTFARTSTTRACLSR